MAELLASQAQSARALLVDVDPAVSDLLDTALEFTAGGKMLRPTFCHAGWLIAGGNPNGAEVAAAGAAFEWLQASALVHDDLMDGSDTRRGRPSVHREYESRHKLSKSLGDAELFGTRVAIVLGDLLLSWADEQFRLANPDVRTAKLWDACKSEVAAGQFLDVLAQTKNQFDLASARHVVRFKAAKYTVERPLHIGAAMAGASDGVLAKLSAVALPLGEAFQLRDDVLGVFGDPTDTGKPAGDDLREGKRTTLIARTAEVCGHDRVLELLGHASGVDELRDLIVSTGALAAVENDIATLTEQTLTAIKKLGGSANEILDPLVDAAIRRVR